MALVSYKCTDTTEDYEERKTLPCPFSENDRSIVKGSFGIFFCKSLPIPTKSLCAQWFHDGFVRFLRFHDGIVRFCDGF